MRSFFACSALPLAPLAVLPATEPAANQASVRTVFGNILFESNRIATRQQM